MKICVIAITHQGYIKRIPANTYRSQNREGAELLPEQAEDDFVTHLFLLLPIEHPLFHKLH